MGTNRTPQKQASDKLVTADLYVKGATLRDIANVTGCTVDTVHNDLKEIREEWKKSTIADYDTRVAVELQKLDKLETEAWKGWELSLQDAEEITYTKERQIKPKWGQKAKAARMTQKEKKVKGQSGNPSFLSIVTKCIERRCQILGIDQPKKIAPVKLDEDGKWVPDGGEEGKRIYFATIMARAGIPVIVPPVPQIEHTNGAHTNDDGK